MKRNKKILFSAVYTILLFVTTVTLMEITSTLLINNSSFLAGNLLSHFRTYYKENDRKIIQYLSDCAIYDAELTYTLKPGQCSIKNREFEVEYSINSAGMRDNESSLVSPKIIVVGDSHAMGWGVKQDFIFASLLEKKLGKKVLNAAISSYGTYRELKILERTNLDSLEYLIVQYSDNDFIENQEFQRQMNKLPIMSEARYNLLKFYHSNNIKYFFGKYSLYFASKLINAISRELNKKTKAVLNNYRPEVGMFMNVLLESKLDLTKVSIILIEVNGYNQNDSKFIDEFKQKVLNRDWRYRFKSIKIIDTSPILEDDHYFVLDDHINKSGHNAIAEILLQFIELTQNSHEK